MRRLVVAAFAVLLLAGCSGADVGKVDSSGGVEPAANESAEPEVYAIGDTIKIDDLYLEVGRAEKFTSDNEFIQPDKGKVFYAVRLGILNKGSEKADLLFTYKLEDANGVQTDQDYMLDLEEPLEASSLAPDGGVGGWIGFQAPENLKGLSLVIEPNVFLDQQVKVKLTD